MYSESNYVLGIMQCNVKGRHSAFLRDGKQLVPVTLKLVCSEDLYGHFLTHLHLQTLFFPFFFTNAKVIHPFPVSTRGNADQPRTCLVPVSFGFLARQARQVRQIYPISLMSLQSRRNALLELRLAFPNVSNCASIQLPRCHRSVNHV